MKNLFLITLVTLAPLANASSFICQVPSSLASDRSIDLKYNEKTQLLEAEGPKWTVSAYTTRQVSKTSGRTFLTVPQGYMFEAVTIEVSEDGNIAKFSLSGEDYQCSRLN